MASNQEADIRIDLGKMIYADNLTKVYNEKTVPVDALKKVSFRIKAGEFVAILGPSGSGKSTLLHVLGLLDKPTEGVYEIDGVSVSSLPEEEKSYYRLSQLGYIFQEYALIDEMTALGNVSLPLMMNGISQVEAEEDAKEALDHVGLKGKYDRLQSQLSGGERQRVAIARAIVSKPKIIFADEPCANVDTKTSEQIMNLFKDLNRKFNLTIIMVTHEEWHEKYVDRVIKLKDGEITRDWKR